MFEALEYVVSKLKWEINIIYNMDTQEIKIS